MTSAERARGQAHSGATRKNWPVVMPRREVIAYRTGVRTRSSCDHSTISNTGVFPFTSGLFAAV